MRAAQETQRTFHLSPRPAPAMPPDAQMKSRRDWRTASGGGPPASPTFAMSNRATSLPPKAPKCGKEKRCHSRWAFGNSSVRLEAQRDKHRPQMRPR